MRPQPRFVGALNPVAILRHFKSYKVLAVFNRKGVLTRVGLD